MDHKGIPESHGVNVASVLNGHQSSEAPSDYRIPSRKPVRMTTVALKIFNVNAPWTRRERPSIGILRQSLVNCWHPVPAGGYAVAANMPVASAPSTRMVGM